jgi:hypothetical protein
MSELAADHGSPVFSPRLVSVIIPMLNCRATLGAQLDALSAQQYR